MQELSASTNRFGDYILHDRIGAGGMAEIFLATATGIEGFEKRVVIKRILPSLSDDQQFVRMFIEEAKLCVALRHPNIVQVHDLGEIDAQYYIAMEYVDGRDLLKTLAACGKKKIGFPTDIALFIVMEVLKGLHYAHQLKKQNGDPLGIIHRDVSPSNVLLSFEGEVKIGDFGIAKANTREKTATGILKGKFGYMAPEQVTGIPIDSRADVFAIGIVMYELLTGHRLFAGKNDLAVLEKVRDARIEPPPRFYRQDLDPELEHLVMRALSREARDRYQTAYELHDAIHDYVYRSRATVGPAHLARFMQTLFLNDPEEIDRRNRVRLPHPRAFPMSTHSAGIHAAGIGAPRNGASSNGRVLELVAGEGQGEFDEKTPLLDPADLPGSRLQSSMAFISDVESWERAGSSALIDYKVADTVDPDRVKTKRPPPLPPLTRVPRIESNALGPKEGERTARTDVEIEVEPAPIAIDDSARSPLARVAALRAAVENDSPTDLDLSEDSKRQVARAVETVHGRRPTSERVGSAIDTEIDESADEIRRVVLAKDEVDDTTQRSDDEDDYHDPSDIVERTVSRPGLQERDIDDDEELTSEVDFPSSNRGLGDPSVTTATGTFPTTIERSASEASLEETTPEREARERESYALIEADTNQGTMQLEDGELPTTEVPEDQLWVGSVLRSETDTIPAPSRPDVVFDRDSSRTDIQVEPPDALVSPILDEEANDRTENEVGNDSLESMIYPDRSSSVSAAQQAVADIRRARRASRMANDQAKEEARDIGPSRRRPITSRRARPLLMPGEDEDGSRLTENLSSSSSGRPRRRATATRSLSVVNPTALPRQPSLRRQPIVQLKPRAESDFSSDVTGAGFMIDEETQSGEMAAVADVPQPIIEATPQRRSSSGVTAALSEAAMIDEEIEEIRSSTDTDDHTVPQMFQGDRDFDPEFDEEDTKEGEKVKEAIDRIQSRKRIVTQNFVLYSEKQAESQPGFGYDDSDASAPVITSAGRLEDEGASDLFGVLGVLDNGRLGELGFAAEEEVSLETESRDYGWGETRFGLLAGEEETDGEVFGEDEPTSNVTDADARSVSELIKNSSLPMDPDIFEMAKEESGISISLEPDDRDESVPGDLIGAPSSKIGFDFEFTDNDETTEEQDDAEMAVKSRSKSVLDEPAGIQTFDDTSNQRPLRLISDSFDLEKPAPPPKVGTKATKAAPPPVRPVTMNEPPDSRTSYPDDELVEPGRARPSNASALRRVVQRHKIAKEVRTKGTPAEGIPVPLIPALNDAAPLPMHAKGSRAAPSAGQFYPPSQNVEVRGSGALNKFATFAVLIAVLLAVAAAVSILLQNRARVPIPPMETAEAPPPPPPAQQPQHAIAPPVAPPPVIAPPPVAPPPVAAPPPPVAPPPPAPHKLAPPPPPPPVVAPPPPPAKKTVAPAKQPPPLRAPPPPARKKQLVADRDDDSDPDPPAKKKKKPARIRSDKAVLRVSCPDPIDVKISSIGTVAKQKKKYSGVLKPGDYRVTLIQDGERKQFDISAVPGDPVIIRCPF